MNILTCIIAYFLSMNAGKAGSSILFNDVSVSAGVSGDTYFSAGSHGLGVNWVDVNNDGWDDLFVVAGEPGSLPNLFINDQDGTFTRSSDFLPELPKIEMSGSRFADYDRDGDKDIFIYTDNLDFNIVGENNLDGPPNILLKNQFIESGAVTFVRNEDQAGLNDTLSSPFGVMQAYRSKTASWLDYNRDGCIDLYVGHLAHNSGGHAANKDQFYKNNCDGTFSDVTEETGINPGNDPQLNRAALAMGAFHLTDDLWPDIYIVNVTGVGDPIYHNDLLYIHQGTNKNASGSTMYQEMISASPGVGNDSQAGMGVDTADIDRDGDWDLYISDLAFTDLDDKPLGNVLYLNQGGGQFSDNSAVEDGVEGRSSWGVNFFDFNHDTWEDLYVAAIQDLLYLNDGVGKNGRATFTRLFNAAGIDTGNARGSAVSDFDKDGDLDLAVVSQAGNFQLFRNDSTQIGNWIVIELSPQISNLDSIGTIIKTQTGNIHQMRQVKGGSSAHSQDSLNVHFGMANIEIIETLIVLWPSGEITTLNQIPTNQYITVAEIDVVFSSGFD